MINDTKLALMIDGENISTKYCEKILGEVAKYGIATIKRVYGDFTIPSMQSWKSISSKYAIQPMLQIHNTTAKNTSDSALIIDAMDFLHRGNIDGFCIASSDSDFTRLATRIREAGLAVYGLGEKKTPEFFIAACNQFIFLDNPDSKQNLQKESQLKKLLKQAIDAGSDEGGWALLANVGVYLQKIDPSFSHKNYGYSKLSDLVSSLEYIKTDKRYAKDISHIIIQFIESES